MFLIQVGIIFCALSVIIGAFGAHSLENIIADKIDIFKTGVQYQIFHGLALILTGILSKVLEINLNISGYLFIIGIILFSGTLYLISIYKYSFLGIITPIGGLSFVIGWFILIFKISNH
jgi:uncharacterized membrane protein YgdD (TMEM256/DUF423 family)